MTSDAIGEAWISAPVERVSSIGTDAHFAVTPEIDLNWQVHDLANYSLIREAAALGGA